MDSTWILVADSGRGRIFELHQSGHLMEIEDFANPAERERNADLRTDGYGRFYGKGEREQGHTAEPDISPKQHEAERFAAHIADYLVKAKNLHQYERLKLVADPRFLGLLRAKLDEEVLKLVDLELGQDLSKASVRELEQRLGPSLH